MARTVNSQQMYDYILHCLKTTYKYFALPLNFSAANRKRGAKQGLAQEADSKDLSEELPELSDFSQLSLHSSQTYAAQNGPEDSDCIIEEEEEIEECSDSDEERDKEKVDLGKSSLSEDEEDEEEQDEDGNIDAGTHDRPHLDSFTTEDEEIFQVDEISGDELLSDEEGPDLDTPGSMDEEEEEELDLEPARLSPPPPEGTIKDEGPDSKIQKQSRLAYEFTRQAFTRGKVPFHFMFVFNWPTVFMRISSSRA